MAIKRSSKSTAPEAAERDTAIPEKADVSVPEAVAEQAAPAKTPSPFAHRDDQQNRWTFLTNHSHVLILLSQDSSMVLREVAIHVGITERAVQRIIVDLEDGGFIEREKVGRKNQYKVLTTQSLRHPIEAHKTIGDLISMITTTKSADGR